MSNVNPDAGRGVTPALGPYFVVPVLASGLTIYYLVSTTGLIWEAKSTGIVIGTILLALCAAQIGRLSLRVVRGEGTLGFGELVADTLFNRQRLALLVLTALFIATLPWVGTSLGLFIILVISIRVMGVRDWRVLVAVGLITAAVVHLLLIYLLGSQLPEGVLKPFFSFIGI